MSTLVEIEAAVRELTHEQKRELIRLLEAQLRPGSSGARLVPGPKGTLLLQAPPGRPPMTTASVKRLLADFP